MSADAKAWTDERGFWHAIHDGDCHPDSVEHAGTSYDLTEILQDIERCMGGKPLRWVMHEYPTGLGLRGYVV